MGTSGHASQSLEGCLVTSFETTGKEKRVSMKTAGKEAWDQRLEYHSLACGRHCNRDCNPWDAYSNSILAH